MSGRRAPVDADREEICDAYLTLVGVLAASAVLAFAAGCGGDDDSTTGAAKQDSGDTGESITFLPGAVGFAAASLLFYGFYSGSGPVDGLMQDLGITDEPINWLGTPNAALFSTIALSSCSASRGRCSRSTSSSSSPAAARTARR